MAKLDVIANPQRVPEWVAVCPTCGGPVQCGVEVWESETGIPLSEGLYVECAADDHEGEVETQMPYIYWLPVRQRVVAWARLALRMGDGGLRPATSTERWRVMAETSAIRKGLTPWGNLSALKFMQDMAREGGEATLRVVGRPDVASGLWWACDWVGTDKAAHSVTASGLQLLMERAAAVELGAIAAAEREWGEGEDGQAADGIAAGGQRPGTA